MWDQDNTTLTYAITRDTSTTPIYTTTVNSTFWNRPALSYVDKNLTPGSTHSYKVRVTDPFGNTVLSAATSVTISSTTVDAYTASVLASGPVAFWPLSQPAGSALAYDRAGGADLTMGAHGTFGVAGPHAGSSAVSFQGDPSTQWSIVPPATLVPPVYSTSTSGAASTATPLSTYSLEAWVKTTSTTGGMIVGDGLWQTGDSWVDDRVLYFDAAGDLHFGAYNNGPTDAGLDQAIGSPTAYNDGSWHYVVGTLGAAGAALYVDGVQVASDPTMVDTSVFYGHWRIGGDAIDGLPLAGVPGWPSAPANPYLAGSIADVAVYPTALSAATVLSHYNGGAVGASSPIAKFTSTCSAESCAFNASTSTDTGGTITAYSWNFGDGSAVVTGASPTTTHVYPTATTYSATLTISDNTTSTDVVSHNVSPNFGTGNPVAAFTTNCTALSCSFDASGSTDTGGAITTYSWNFGDGTPVVTGASPTVTHVYAAPSFYVPTLTVTDNTTSISTIYNLLPVGASAPQAAFTSNCTGLSCSFDASGSTDTGAVITMYSWNFGDGTTVVTGASPTVTHAYAGANTDHVTLTVIDSTTSTNSITHDVAPTAAPPPSTPVAAFTSNCTNLSCAFDGSTSSDTGGVITTYTWNFGDGSTGTGVNPTHVYASANTYSVTLTVTDDQTDTNATSANVAPTAAPPPSTPVAAFTSNCTNLSCAFDGSTSSDTGGVITTYTWNFGDGSTGTGVNPTHVYASANTYSVTLTVTNDQTDTNATSANVSPTNPVVTLFASDTFNRTVAGGLGTADLGGAWTRVGGTAANLSVAPGLASFLMPAAAAQDSVYLASVSKTTSETDTTFTDNNVSTGTAGVYVYVDGRRVGTNNEYDARIRITSAGQVAVELTKYAGSATATAITSEIALPGVKFTPGTQINVRFQVSGTSPTTLKVKVWLSTSAEPAAWTLTATDTSAGLQAAGAVGLTTYLSGSTTNAPTTVKFSSFSAGPLQP